ncbi:YceD family protein [Aidingimonas halophila]|nr:YceD family protein [Aidingimonas halophila]GHC20522.1 hypothetical protein GCM10008094_08520 [Aidingimonas halophila]
MLTERLPLVVEPYRLAANDERVEGLLALSRLERLALDAPPQDGECQVRLDFFIDEQGRRVIDGWLKADLRLACRRCLQPMPVQVENHFLLGIVSGDELAAALPSTHEPVLAENEQLNLLEVIEDELILSLPQVVYHDEADCGLSRDQLSSGAEVESSNASTENPFEVLRHLKGKSDS